MKKLLLLAAVSGILTACATPDIFNENSDTSYQVIKDVNLIAESHNAGQNLMAQAPYLKKDLKAVLITSIAYISDIDSSSDLGLTISEQIGNRFVQLGFPVVDLRTRHDIKIREETGEFMLSRDIKKISRDHTAGAVLVGTYTPAKDAVYISTRLIRPADNRVLASYDFKLPMGPDIKKMVNKVTK